MKKVKADRYQKQRSPEPEAIDFSGPAIGTKPAKKNPSSSETEAKNDDSTERTTDHSNARTLERRDERSNEQTVERIEKRPDERSDDEVRGYNSYLIVVPKERVKTRQSFDIFDDQKLALDRLQMAIRDVEGEKPNLGELVQEALDAYIETRTSELSNVQTLNRTNERSEGGESSE